MTDQYEVDGAAEEQCVAEVGAVGFRGTLMGLTREANENLNDTVVVTECKWYKAVVCSNTFLKSTDLKSS